MSEKTSDTFKTIVKILNLENEEKIKEEIVNKISWNHIFLLEALLWSYRSHDAQTQCGCVLVKNNTVLSTGYNGFICGIDDSALPNLRPYKYDFMIHAEHNAILNCVRNGISTSGATAYITGEPCNWCLQYMWQAGISTIVYSDFNSPKMVDNEKHQQIKKALLTLMNPSNCWGRMSIIFIPSSTIDFSPIRDIYEKDL